MTQKKQITKKKGISAGKVVAIGAGVAALGAGAYYFLGPNGKKNQKKTTVWMTKMKKGMGKKMATLKNVSKPIYYNTVDTLADNYSKQYKEYTPEIKAFAELLKSKWKGTEKAKPAIKQSKKAVKKTTARRKVSKK